MAAGLTGGAVIKPCPGPERILSTSFAVGNVTLPLTNGVKIDVQSAVK
jgi:hypothetical protein